MLIKNKIINHITKKGKKPKSEKILNNSFKNLQKNSKKQTKKLIQLSIILSSKIFKIRAIKNKKNRKKKIRFRPTFIADNKKRFSFAIKTIVTAARENKANYYFLNKLTEETFLTTQIKSISVKNKKELEKDTLKKEKHLFKYYRWF